MTIRPAASFCSSPDATRSCVRPSVSVRPSGVSLRESGFWNVHLYRCQNATIENADIRTPAGAPSTDGIDIDSCQDVTVRGTGHVTRQEVLDRLALDSHRTLFSINPEQLAARVRTHPWVKDAKVTAEIVFDYIEGVIATARIKNDLTQIEKMGRGAFAMLGLEWTPSNRETVKA